ncbi:MAG: NAD-dependent epimerase/dehydratase family protein, partial [Candidatus Omnitrophota bacterium]
MGHKLLLIGGTGLLGSEVFFCAKDKFDVILASETKDSNYLTEEITSKNWRYCDITKPDTIEKMLDEEDFDYIVLLAAKIATLSGSVVDSNSELFRVNFKGNMDALRLISRNPGQKFIFI